jgi:hypothetical protein
MKTSKDLQELLKQLQPRLHQETYCYVYSKAEKDPLNRTSFCVVKEKEGVTYIMTQKKADDFGLPYTFTGKLITLEVYSDLHAVGLTMVVSTTLANAGIPCNSIAGYHHDHILVPEEQGQKAMRILQELTNNQGDPG